MKKNIIVFNLILLIFMFTFLVSIFDLSKNKVNAQNEFTESEVQYNIIFEENGGSEVFDTIYIYGEEYVLPFDIWRDGYVFMGWTLTNDSSDVNYIYKIEAGESGHKTFYAKWKAEVNYIVEHYFEDIYGIFELDSTKTEIYQAIEGEKIVALPLSGLTGFEFDSDNNLNILEGVASFDVVTLSVYYTRTVHDVLIVVENEEYGSVDTTKVSGIKYGTPIFINDKIASIGDNVVVATPIAGDAQYSYKVTGYSNFESVQSGAVIIFKFERVVNKYTITFYNHDGQYLSESTIEYGQDATFNGDEPDGWETDYYTYVFDYWVSGLGSLVKDDLTNVVANRSVYAQFKAVPKTFKITYNTVFDDVTFVDGFVPPTSYTYGQGLVLPTREVINKDYYVFDGWYLNYTPAIDTQEEQYYELVTEFDEFEYGDKTVYAKWVLEEYTLTLKIKNIYLESFKDFEYISNEEYVLERVNNKSEFNFTLKKIKGYDLPINIIWNETSLSIYDRATVDGLTMTIKVNSGDITSDTTIEIEGVEGDIYWFDAGIVANSFSDIDLDNKVIKISTPNELGLLASYLFGDYHFEEINLSQFHIQLKNDIDLGEYAWYPMVFDFASFDGGNYTIKNMKLSNIPYCEYYGLFSIGTDENSSIRNLNLTGTINLSNEYKLNQVYIGCLIAYSNLQEMVNVSTNVKIDVAINENTQYYIGGIVGVYTSEFRVDLGIENSYALGDINIEMFMHNYICVGGLVGELNNKIINNSYYAGEINQFSSYEIGIILGGLVGKSSAFDLYQNSISKVSSFYNVLGYIVSSELVDMNNAQADFMFEEDMLSKDNDTSLLAKLNAWLKEKNNQKYYSWRLKDGYPILDEPYKERYMVEKILTRVTIDDGDFAYVAEDYVVNVKVAPGYSITSMLINIGGDNYTGYTYENNVLTIYKEYIVADIVIIIETKVNTNTLYTIVHYLEQLDGSFKAEESLNIVKYGQTDTNITLDNTTDITGFIYDENNQNNVLSGNIYGDGSLQLHLYYLRENYSISIRSNLVDAGSVNIGILNNVRYGTPVTILDNTIIIDGVTITASVSQNTDQYTYAFIGWDINEVIQENEIITAKFSKTLNVYNVIWKNGGEILETDLDVPYGTLPTYDGDTPTKSNQDNYGYVFLGWSPSVTEVKCDTIYIADFNQVLIKIQSAKDDEVGENIDAEIDLVNGVELDTKLIITTKNSLKYDLKLPFGREVVDVYNITLRKGNSITNVNLEGIATLKVEIPEALKNRSGVKILITNGDSFIEIPAEVEDGYFIFETEVLGQFILVANIRLDLIILGIVLLLVLIALIVFVIVKRGKHKVTYMIDAEIKGIVKLSKGLVITSPYGYEKYVWYLDSELNNSFSLGIMQNKSLVLYGKKITKRNKKETFEEKILLDTNQKEVKLNVGNLSDKFVDKLRGLDQEQKETYVKVKNYLLGFKNLNNYLTYESDLFEYSKNSYIKIYFNNNNLIIMIYDNEESQVNTGLQIPFALILNDKNYNKIISNINEYLKINGIESDGNNYNFDLDNLI